MPRAEETSKRQVGSPQPPLGPITLVVAEARWLLLNPVSEHRSSWGCTTLT